MYQQTQTYLVQLTALLQKHQLWQSEPIDADALLSNTPFCHDTMAFEQWLQFVFIDKIQQLITHKQPLPRNFAIAPMAQMTLVNKAGSDEIIELLTALDTFLGEPMSERPAPIEYGELTILYQDESYVAINKPSGLLVHRSFLDKHETQFAMQMLRDQLGQHVFPVHRLDRPTSGVLLFALSSEAARDMNQLFIEGTIAKRYLALVRGFAPESVFLDKPLKEELDKIADKFADQDKAPQEAQTQFNCLHQVALPIPIGKYPTVRYSLVECFPKTGRKHQIRRHLKHLSLPIIGDVNHGDNQHNQFFRDHFELRRLMLFATELSFVHPYSNESITIKAPLGEDMLEICKQLGWPEQEKDY